MKKLLALLLTVLCVLSLTACGGGETQSGEEKLTIGVVQLMQHPALDLATEGFIEAVKAEFPNADIKVQVAGNPENCITVATGLVTDGVKLIMANATPAVTAAATATADIPVVGTAVTEYGAAFGIENFSGVLGTNVTGASDLAPLDQQAQMVLDLFPETKTVSILYCVTEANSIYQVNAVEKELVAKGIEVKKFGFSETADIQAVCEDAARYGDVMYIPTDNTCATYTETIANVVLSDEFLTPVIAGEEGICSGCGVATLTIGYKDLGIKTGKMAVEILKGADPKTMEIQYADTFTPKYNPINADKFGVTDKLVELGYQAQ